MSYQYCFDPAIVVFLTELIYFTSLQADLVRSILTATIEEVAEAEMVFYSLSSSILPLFQFLVKLMHC